MKIITNHPTPVRPTFTVQLTYDEADFLVDELVRLAPVMQSETAMQLRIALAEAIAVS